MGKAAGAELFFLLISDESDVAVVCFCEEAVAAFFLESQFVSLLPGPPPVAFIHDVGPFDGLNVFVEEEKWHHPLSVAYRYIATAGALLNILVFLGTIGASYAKYMEHNSDGYTPPM